MKGTSNVQGPTSTDKDVGRFWTSEADLRSFMSFVSFVAFLQEGIYFDERPQNSIYDPGGSKPLEELEI